ncbi:hypothetical protein BDV96DRAFT_652676 [Lophiotrema nucula]|uniref:Jacalin-type lectin domain-containing protein n=1 Tax=Lophiotrema nucula TaxID=690887 RepID=A0A6A5YP74_9PLEO|nr:hypothetical protein BDV96DRAFT_652676 [Lophiotrema nucula]
MVFLLLAPYNDSMQLGQGFNSFLQLPCMNGAVEVSESALKTQAARAGGVSNVSQVVSYSSRFVEKISDVVRSMNISAASSIKSGTIEVSGNSLSVDEAKFASSDLNAVVSVKVINQTTQMTKNPRFVPMDGVEMDSEKFFDYYGDCYISGFMEGGDLHGIVSMKVLDASKKSEVEAALKGQMNGTANEFTLSEGTSSSNLNATMSQTEATITMNWSGGGQIKSEDEEWSLESMFRAAAAFPKNVAACPQRTWAILTKYDNNRSFLEWADKRNIKVPQFSNVQQYTSDLLDMYMEYKNNLARIQACTANPAGFKLSPYRNPVNLSIESMVKERKLIKAEMKKIVDVIDQINNNPSVVPAVEIEAPEVWATRLPVPLSNTTLDNGFNPTKAVEVLSGFSFVNDPIVDKAVNPPAAAEPAPDAALKSAMAQVQQSVAQTAAELPQVSPFAPPPLAALCSQEIYETLNENERAFVDLDDNKRLYANYRFDRATGHDGGGPFNDATDLQQAMIPVTWPSHIEFRMIQWGPSRILRFVQVIYDQMQLQHGSDGTVAESMSIDLAPDERISRIRLGKGHETWGVEGVAFVEVHTTSGQTRSMGNEEGIEVIDYYPPGGYAGLKGFWGGCGDVLDKLAPIWG